MRKKNERMIRALAMPVVLIMMLSAIAAATGTVHNIDKGTNYTTIQDAIGNASIGDRIYVDSGIYYESLNVSQEKLIIKGVDTEGGIPTINANGNKVAVALNAGSITLEGFNITNASSMGVRINSNNNIITGNIISGNNYGIYSYSTANNTLGNNTLSNDYYGIDLEYSSDNVLNNNDISNTSFRSIYLSHSNNNTLTNNIVSGNQNGIILSVSSNNTVSDNNASNNNYQGILIRDYSANNVIRNNNALNNQKHGIYLLSNGNNNTLSGNNFSGSEKGIYLSSSNNNTISSNNASSNYDGIYIYHSNNNTVDTNYAASNDKGIYLGYFSNNNTISSNNASSNNNGIYVSSSFDNRIFHNNFVNNTMNAITDPGTLNQWNNGTTGNYWSDYSGIDSDNDGIGNTPYNIFGGSEQDIYPLMNPYISAPTPTRHIAFIPIKDAYSADYTPVDIGILKERAKYVSKYYNQQSYGKEILESDFVFDDWSHVLPFNSPAQFMAAAFSEATTYNSKFSQTYSYYDAVIVIAATDKNFDPQSNLKDEDCSKSGFWPCIGIINEKSAYGEWTHELGHALFGFRDRYGIDAKKKDDGDIGYWGLMGLGGGTQWGINLKPLEYKRVNVNPSAPIESEEKNKAGWLKETEIKIGSIQKISLLKDEPNYYYVKPDAGKVYKYVIEGRTPPDGVVFDPLPTGLENWQFLSETKGILLYQYENGSNSPAGKLNTIPWCFKVPLLGTTSYKVTLVPDGASCSGKRYFLDSQLYFEAHEENSDLYLSVQPLQWTNVKSVSISNIKIQTSAVETGLPAYNSSPDVDLKVFDLNGGMVGMNYSSGEYELGIAGANTSGDIPGEGSEWISVPIDTDIYSVIDATPAGKWAEENNITILNITAEIQLIQYDQNGTRTETKPVNITIDIANPIRVVQTSELLPDITPSIINLSMPLDKINILLNENMNAIYSVTDPDSGVKSVTATVPNGSLINTSTVGPHNFTVNATDNAGNTANLTITYNVLYNFNDLTNKKIAKSGSAILIKFNLTDFNGKIIETAKPRIYIVNGSSEIAATSTGNANIENIARFVTADNQYIYNLNTRSLPVGTPITIGIRLDDGTIRKIQIELN